MCGIAGIFCYRHQTTLVDGDELLLMREAMLPRGPDGEGMWMSECGTVGLAHRRLSIIDLSGAGKQPMAIENGRYRIAFNGEIYNYQALRRELESDGCSFRSTSDTEVLLHLYAKHGPDMVHALRGMFAFAIWDDKNRKTFFARDPFGIKPLYYADDGKSLRFASQVKALAAGGRLDLQLDPAGQVGFFLWGHIPEPFTQYRNIRSLPPGSTMEVSNGGQVKISSYADPIEFIRSCCESPIVPEKPMREILLDSITAHQVADVPVGVFLSAGIDSTTLCGLMAETTGQSLHSITLGFKEYINTPNDEVPLAEVVAGHYKTHHESKWIDKSDFTDVLPHFLSSMDVPSTDGINTYFVSKVAAASGLKVAISGVGGDELFGGYPSFKQIPKLVGAVGKSHINASIGRGFRWLSSPILKRFTSPKYAGIFEYGGDYGGAYLLRRSLYMPWELPSILDVDVVRDGWQELQTRIHLQDTVQGLPGDFCSIMALELQWYMQSRLLRDADWAGMAHSLEIRTPLVDWEIFKALVPFLIQERNRPTKKDFASIVAKPLPKAVVDRPKSGFSVPIHGWLDEYSSERGLRGWAKFIGKEFNLV